MTIEDADVDDLVKALVIRFYRHGFSLWRAAVVLAEIFPMEWRRVHSHTAPAHVH